MESDLEVFEAIRLDVWSGGDEQPPSDRKTDREEGGGVQEGLRDDLGTASARGTSAT